MLFPDGEVKLELDLVWGSSSHYANQLLRRRRNTTPAITDHVQIQRRTRLGFDSRFSQDTPTITTPKRQNATLTLLPHPPHTADNRPAPLHSPQTHDDIALPIPIPTHPPHTRRPHSSDKSHSNTLHPPPSSIPHISNPPGNIQPSTPGVPGCAACAAIAVSGARGPVPDEGCLLEDGDYEAQEAEFGGEEDGES